MAVYYTLETIRNQINNLGGVIDYASNTCRRIDPLPPDWEYCPCPTKWPCKGQRVKVCSVTVGISFDTINNSLPLVFEIIYVLDVQNGTGHGFIRAEQKMIEYFLADAGVDTAALHTVTTMNNLL